MTDLVLAVAVFIVAHAIPAWRPVREGLVRAIGERSYVVLYTVLSLGLAVWVGYAYAEAPYVEVWPFRTGLRWIPLGAMPIVCVLLIAGLTSPNPLSVGWGSKGYDPERPGINAVTRHPVMWAFVLWAAAHMVPNGDVASLLLFGLLLGLGLAGPASLDAKRRAKLGAAEWSRLADATSNVPLAAVLEGKTRVRIGEIGWKRILGGLVLYAALLHLHGPVIGVSPYPF